MTSIFAKLLQLSGPSPIHKSAHWNEQHDELKNEHLTIDQLIPPKTCFKCGNKGHVATNCNNFSGKNKNRNNFGGSSHSQRFQNPPPPPGPPPQPPQPFPAYQFQSPYSYPQNQPAQVGPPTFPANNQSNSAAGNNGKKFKYCNTWNHSGSCWRGPTCYFLSGHICNRCGQTDHGGINCKNQTSTAFSPTAGYTPRF